MKMKGNRPIESSEAIQYKYIVECKEKTVELEVDTRDVFYNADDELDCPLDVVLRKNSYTLEDLTLWDPKEIHFIQIERGTETVVNSISMNVNL